MVSGSEINLKIQFWEQQTFHGSLIRLSEDDLKDVFTFHFQKHQQEKGTGYTLLRVVFLPVKYRKTIILNETLFLNRQC